MRVVKISNSKSDLQGYSRALAMMPFNSDLQGYSRALAMMPFNRPHTTFYYCSIATVSLSCTISEILSLISQNLKSSCDKNGILLYVITSGETKKRCGHTDGHFSPV